MFQNKVKWKKAVSKGWCKESSVKVIKLFSCSTNLSVKYILLINVKSAIIHGILTFISRITYPLIKGKMPTNDWLWRFKPDISINFGYFSIYEQFKFQDEISFITLEPVSRGQFPMLAKKQALHSMSHINMHKFFILFEIPAMVEALLFFLMKTQ